MVQSIRIFERNAFVRFQLQQRAKRMAIIQKDCGIEYERLAAWFDDADLLDCTVELTQKPDRVLSRTVSLPITAMRIEGDQDAVQQLYRAFELAFMSAGG